MNPFINPVWKHVLKWAMPVIIEAGSSFYNKQSQARPGRQASDTPDSQAEQIEALKSAMIRIAEEIEASNGKQVALAHTIAQLRWLVIAAGLLAIVALVIAFAK